MKIASFGDAGCVAEQGGTARGGMETSSHKAVRAIVVRCVFRHIDESNVGLTETLFGHAAMDV